MTHIAPVTACVEDIREAFKSELRTLDLAREAHAPFQHEPETIELIGSSFIADEPTIFGAVNAEYVAREIAWYELMVTNINTMEGAIPKIWKQVASADGSVNSNYGYLMYSAPNGNQYDNVLEQLQRYPQGRRATAIYTRPTMHTDWSRDGMSDFVCTNAVCYFIRNNRLNAVVQMRSNDVVFGYRNDFAWQQHVLLQLCSDIGVEPGEMIWQAASLHVYRRHWDLVRDDT